jgi:type II secretory pathway predicted ATPase ExeA
MYETHFGLRERPFRPTPDSACYYAATSHEHALSRLLQAVADDEGMALVTGDPGTGKTLLCHRLLERLGPDVASAFLTNSHVAGPAGLLQAILYELSLPYEGRGEQELRLSLTDHLLHSCAAGRRTVLVMDEAQHLEPDLLEELRLLANLESRRAKAFQVVLAGQPALLETLARPSLRALAQRLAVRVALQPLGVEEAADYLLHQLRAAGGRPGRIFTEEALEVLARGTGGLPRLLNQAAHQALALAFAAGATAVDAEAALEALNNLALNGDAEMGESRHLLPVEAAAEDAAGEDAGTAERMLEQGGDSAVTEGAGEPGEEDGQACRLFPSPRPA